MIKQTLNYSAHAIDSLLTTRRRLEGRWPQGDLEGLDWVIQTLRIAPKFLLIPGGRYFNDEAAGTILWKLLSARLPYPTVVLEYTVDEASGAIDAGALRSSKRIAICHIGTQPPRRCAEDIDLTSTNWESPALWVLSVSYMDASEIWTPMPGFVRQDLEETYERHRKISEADAVATLNLDEPNEELLDFSARAFVGRTVFTGKVEVYPLLLKMANKWIEDYGEGGYVQQVTSNTNDELNAAIEFAVICGCSNVHVEKIAAPEKLNAKRVKAGKPAIDAYHVLAIDVSEGHTVAAPAKGGSSATAESERASPRAHLRRGHIRTLAQDRPIWVNSTVVRGDRLPSGLLEKDYSVRKHRPPD